MVFKLFLFKQVNKLFSKMFDLCYGTYERCGNCSVWKSVNQELVNKQKELLLLEILLKWMGGMEISDKYIALYNESSN